MKSAVLDLAKELIARPSISPVDGGCQEVLADRLKPLGFTIENMPFGDVSNLWATRGRAAPLFVFAGHTDVVPTGQLEGWDSDPFEPTTRAGYLFGRGAADMKSSLAAMVVATETFISKHPEHHGSIGFLITSDEEDAAINGTAKVMDVLSERGQQIDWCLVGEPSSATTLGDTIRVGRRGSLNAKLTLRGMLGHVAYPDATPNVLHETIRCLKPLVNRQWDSGNAYFSESTFQISNLNAGTGAENVIPEQAEVAFNFRYNTQHTDDELKSAVQEALQELDQRVEYELNFRTSGKPFLSMQGKLREATKRAIHTVTGLTPEESTGGGTSDARFIVPRGVEAVELGPVNATIHKINECIALDELEPLTQIYHQVLEHLLTSH